MNKLTEKLYALYYVSVAKHSNAVLELEALEKARDAIAKLSADRYDTSTILVPLEDEVFAANQSVDFWREHSARIAQVIHLAIYGDREES